MMSSNAGQIPASRRGATTMRAACCEAYGPPEVVRLREMALPVLRRDELLIRVQAATVSSGDARVRAMRVPRGFGLLARLALGLRRPRQPVLGTELAGEVVAKSDAGETGDFAIGDPVIGFTDVAMGAHAEYCRVPRSATVPRPPGVPPSEAAALFFGGTTALVFLRRAALQAGERLLVIGAAGSVGSAVVQLARHLGALVTAVCSARNAPLMARLGVNEMLDYEAVDFARSGRRWDVIFDTTGTVSRQRAKVVLSEQGRLVLVAADLPAMLSSSVGAPRGRRVIAGIATPGAPELAELAGLAAQGVLRPVIDRCYPLDRITDAHRYVDEGHKRGNVVIHIP